MKRITIVTKVMSSNEINEQYGMNSNENNTGNDTDDRIVSVIRIIMIIIIITTMIRIIAIVQRITIKNEKKGDKSEE